MKKKSFLDDLLEAHGLSRRYLTNDLGWSRQLVYGFTDAKTAPAIPWRRLAELQKKIRFSKSSIKKLLVKHAVYDIDHKLDKYLAN